MADVKRALTIGGSDPTGGAGIQMDLKVFQSLGVWGLSCITNITVQTTFGVEKITKVPPHIIARQIDAAVLDIGINACKIGMLYSPRTVSVVAERIRRRHIPNVVLDPIIKAKNGRALLTPKALKRLKKELIPLALILTPNLPEAEEISGIPIKSLQDMEEAGKKIKEMGAEFVLIKGGHLPSEPVDILYDGENFHYFPSERIKKNVHGTGCILSSAIAGYLAKGENPIDSVRLAIEFTRSAIERALLLGKGPYYLVPF
ncbi:MAG: bifunctional hydroxymethylpyrimidine kinase/phosphomethylpyrimidine kinase [bacterium]